MNRVKNSAVVSRQLPEHIREDYPTFVAFVEAYYDFLQTQGVDFSTIRDIDRTLEEFVVQFKKELAYNLPNIVQDERFLLQRIKDQYLAKGSEGSYKLLFRLLFGKEVDLVYPNQQMLRASDGRWNQEISIFAKVDFGNPDNVVGKLVDIQTAGRILRVLVDRKQDLIGEIDKIVLIDPTQQIYEFFLDKKFFGNINPGDRIRYLNEFQATILPTTKQLTIVQPGKSFRVGQVFELRSGNGTGALLKVTAVTNDGGIKYAEFIKFGIGYTANFAISILATNFVTSRRTNIVSFSTLVQNNTFSSSGAGTLSASSSSTTVTGSGTSFGLNGNPKVGDELWTTDATPLLIGVIKSIETTTSLTLTGLTTQYGTAISGSYTGSYTYRNDDGVGTSYNPDGIQSFTFSSTLGDQTLGFNEQGFVSRIDYVTEEYVDGTFAGSLSTEFSLNFRNAQINSDDPALITVNLGAIARYPGYFETNNGFLDDSIFIQDSRFYQAFSYVIKIDERLESYKSAVKTMLHPAGMALFGEFNITNNYDLSFELESLVKSLGVNLESEFIAEIDTILLSFSKTLSDNINTPNDLSITNLFGKSLSTSFNTPTDVSSLQFTKSATSSINTPEDSNITRNFTKLLTTSSNPTDNAPLLSFSRSLSTSFNTPTDVSSLQFTKPATSSINTPTDVSSLQFTKSATSSINTPNDLSITNSFGKSLSTSFNTPNDLSITNSFGKSLSTSFNTPNDLSITNLFGKSLSTSFNTPTDVSSLQFTKPATSSINTPTDVSSLQFTKSATSSINTPNDSFQLDLFEKGISNSITSSQNDFSFQYNESFLYTSSLNNVGQFSTSNVPQEMSIDPTGRFAYVATSDTVDQFSIDQATGTLTSITSDLVGSNACSGIIVDSTGRFAYGLGGSLIRQYSINQTSGKLTNNGTTSVPNANFPQIFGIEIVSDFTGRFVYVLTDNNLIRQYSIDQITGVLTDIGTVSVGMSFNYDIIINPSSTFVYVGGFDGVTKHSINQSTGVLTSGGLASPPQIASSRPRHWGIAIEPTGNFMYGTCGRLPSGPFIKSVIRRYLINQATGDLTIPNGDVHEYDLSVPWDISTVSFLQNFSVAAQETAPQSVFFKPDGTKMYVIGSIGDDINEYDLSVAWDVSTAVFLQVFSVAAQETLPTGLFFKPDGTKMYVVGVIGDNINEYNLSSAWNISSASFLRTFSVAFQETAPTGVFFKPDGTKMYVIGVTGDDVNEYNLSSAWNISSASFLRTFSVATQETAPQSVFFKPDGTKMYVVGVVNSDYDIYNDYPDSYIYEYNLSSAWDVSTASFSQRKSVLAQETFPSGVFFKDDGTKMYVTGSGDIAAQHYNAYKIKVDPLGRFVYATAIAGSGGLRRYLIDQTVPSTGSLTFIEENYDSSTLSRITVDPTGKFVYIPQHSQSNLVIQYSNHVDIVISKNGSQIIPQY